ncbi:MAG: hydrogenase nickel incorporation protein HypB [Spirochaetota bacterium]
MVKKIVINKNLRGKDEQIADEIRTALALHHVLAVNLISSPGSGKTTLLEKVLPILAKELKLAVIEADAATRNDADRLEAAGLRVEMISTNITGCHISTAAACKAFKTLNQMPGLVSLDLVVIENVGNLLCPAGVDLGEDAKIAMVSVAEGEDKPLKYPLLFQNAQLALINKIDAAEALGVDIELLKKNITSVNPNIKIISLSARTGENTESFISWIREKVEAKKKSGQSLQ